MYAMNGGYDGSGTLVLWVLLLAWFTVVAVDAVATQWVESDGCWDDVFCELEVARKLCLRHRHAAHSPDVCVYRRSSSGEEGLQRLSKEDLKTLRDSRLSVKSRILIRKRTPVSSIVDMTAQTLGSRTTCNFRSFYTLVDPDSMGKHKLDFTSTPTGVFNQITCSNNTTVSSGSVSSTTSTRPTRMPDSAAASEHDAFATAAASEDSPPNNNRCKERQNRWKAKGYVHEENIIFKIVWEQATWATARNMCRLEGARLLVLSDINKFHNLGKTSFIDRVLNKATHLNPSIIQLYKTINKRFKYVMNFYIGANDIEEEGHYTWIDGKDLKSEGLIWVDKQPDNYKGNEDCVTMQVLTERQTSTRQYALNDDICSLEYWFICEMLPCENSA